MTASAGANASGQPASTASRQGQSETPTIALVGNPNTGKSTLFNALSGVRQRVGNYPGVTVEKKIGRAVLAGQACQIVDLPGSYSLAPRSPDEMVAVDVLLGRRADSSPVDAVICIVDASNLERNLYFVNQVLELDLPTVLALNMVDVARARGQTIDTALLEKRLGMPVVEIQAHRKLGLDRLAKAVIDSLGRKRSPMPSPFPEEFQREVAALEQASTNGADRLPRYLCERLLLDTSGYLEHSHLAGVTGEMLALLPEARQRLAQAGYPVPAVEAMSRYRWVAEVLEGAVKRPAGRPVTASDRIDRVLTHKLWGTLIFALLMAILFQAVFYVAEPASAAIDAGAGWLSSLVERFVPEGALRSLLEKGVIEGVGGVLVFLPQIFTLFLFIAVLEDCGYMARAAYLMDKLMSRVGLSGKSFIPLLSSFACAIPGIMSARVIENRRDRLVTMLVAPLMSCSARLPVYALLIGAFIPDRKLWGFLGLQGLTMFAMYLIGALTAVAVAWALKKTVLRGATPPFIMELPAYKRPSLGVVLHRMLDRGWSFVRRAGTLIFAMTVVIWAAGYYPRNPENLDPELFRRQASLERRIARLESSLESPTSRRRLAAARDDLAQVSNEIESGYLETSYLGRAGKLIEPAVRPLGWDWRIGCAAIASFPAREVVIGALGVIYTLGEDEEAVEKSLPETLRGAVWEGTDRPVFTIPVALSIMVFFALCAQCVSTLAVLRRETNSWRWPAFTFVYMTTLAYLGALVVYQVGTLIGL